MEDGLIFDISRLDTDPLLQSDMVNGLRLFVEDYPAGIRYPGALRSVFGRISLLIDMGMLNVHGGKVVVNPQFAPMIMGRSDYAYINAIKGWVAYTTIVDEVEASRSNG